MIASRKQVIQWRGLDVQGGMALLVFAILALNSAAQVPPPNFATLYSFQDGNDGALPEGPLVIGAGGVLYGTTDQGGGSTCAWVGCGTVYAMAPPASPGAAWTETILYNFPNPYLNGGYPTGGLVIGGGGVLYGTTSSGGTLHWAGTVFQLTPPAAAGGAWTETVLHNFTGRKGDGAKPYAALVIGSHGALYGTTSNGGSYSCSQGGTQSQGCGTVFELDPPATPGGAWTETVLHTFTGQGGDGVNPNGVVLGPSGALYGTAVYGGISNSACSIGCGIIYELTAPAAQPRIWSEKVLYSFTGGSDGAYPYPYPLTGLVIGQNGALYGATSQGGVSNSQCPGGCGTIFELAPPSTAGGAWTQNVIYSFKAENGDGRFPVGVVFGKGGTLFGTTGAGGTADFGTVFEMKPPTVAGGTWTESVLYSFPGGTGAADPFATVAIDANGSLYGTTIYGGTANWGAVYELTP